MKEQEDKSNIETLRDGIESLSPEYNRPAFQEEKQGNKIHVLADPEPTPEEVATPSAEQAKRTENKLQILVDIEPTTLPREEQKNTGMKLQIHIDEQIPKALSPVQNSQKKSTKAFAVLADEESTSQTAPLAEKQPQRDPLKPRTVPLKGFEDEDMQNDENAPPSQVEIEKAKVAKKARREKDSNRTRKIKVMDVKEIPNETQTSK